MVLIFFIAFNRTFLSSCFSSSMSTAMGYKSVSFSFAVAIVRCAACGDQEMYCVGEKVFGQDNSSVRLIQKLGAQRQRLRSSRTSINFNYCTVSMCIDNIVSRNSSHECSVERAAAARVQGPTCHIFLLQQTITKTVHTRHHNTEWSHHDASQNATISNGDPPQHDQASEQEKCSDQCPHHQSLTTPAPPQVKSKIFQKPLFNNANL